MEIRPNSMASKWEDLETLIGKEKILVFTPDGDEVLNPFFREKLEAERASNGWLGASVRWAVQGTARGSLRLVLQGLPMGARALRSDPLLAADESSTVHLDSFEAEADLRSSGPGRGPIPILFARDPSSVKSALSRHPERLWTGKNLLALQTENNRGPLSSSVQGNKRRIRNI